MLKIIVISNDETLCDFCKNLHNNNVFVRCVSSFSEELGDFFCQSAVILLDFELVLCGNNYLIERISFLAEKSSLVPLVRESSAGVAMRLLKYKQEDIVLLPCCIEYLRAYINRFLIKEKSITINSRQKELLSSFVGTSNAITLFKQKLIAVSQNDLSVLILGETGTGKSFIARLIHMLSARHEKKFVEENVAAIQETLIEGELFGTKIGAYTGAISRIGLFEHANNGTLFLDEIACIQNPIQAKLLQVLETGSYRPVGSVEKKIANVRLISATNAPLTHLKDSSMFRDDLYYRISGVQLHVPPLRDRKEDIGILAVYFLKKIVDKTSLIKTFSSDAMIKLEDHDWPGNVRELERCIECAYFMTSHTVIFAYDISFIS